MSFPCHRVVVLQACTFLQLFLYSFYSLSIIVLLVAAPNVVFLKFGKDPFLLLLFAIHVYFFLFFSVCDAVCDAVAAAVGVVIVVDKIHLYSTVGVCAGGNAGSGTFRTTWSMSPGAKISLPSSSLTL